MKRIDLLEEDGTAVPAVGSKARERADALLASPLDVHAYCLDLPPLKGDALEGAVKFRLRSIHPGNPDATRVDCKPNGRARGSVLAFAADAAAADRYAASGLPAVPGSVLLSLHLGARKGRGLAFLVDARWVEAAAFEDGKIVAVDALAANGNAGADLAGLAASVLPEGGAEFVAVVATEGASPRAGEYLEAARALGPAEAVDAALLAARADPAEHALFTPKKARPGTRAFRVLAILALDVLLGAVYLDRLASAREAEAARAKAAYGRAKAAAAEAEAARSRIADLEAAAALAAAARPADAYGLLAAVAEGLGPDAWVRSLSVADGSFQVEAEGGDSLRALERLQADPRLQDVKLHQAVPSPLRGEIFSVSGRLRRDS